MNSIQVHLLLNHVPVVLISVSVFVLIFGLVAKKNFPLLMGLWMLVLGGIFAAPAFLSGERSKHAVEKLSWFSERALENHEELAKLALVESLACGLLALLTLYLWRQKHRHFKLVVFCTLVLAMVTNAFLMKTAHLGGILRHEEIRHEDEKLLFVPTGDALKADFERQVLKEIQSEVNK